MSVWNFPLRALVVPIFIWNVPLEGLVVPIVGKNLDADIALSFLGFV